MVVKPFTQLAKSCETAKGFDYALFAEKVIAVTTRQHVDALRELWYRANDREIAAEDSRAIAINIGFKAGITQCLNQLEKTKIYDRTTK